MTKAYFLAAAMMFAAAPSYADGELDKLLSAADKSRLVSFEQVKAEALAEAHKGGAIQDVKMLNETLSGKPISISGSFNPIGQWRCRIFKLGGSPPLTVYPNFRCRISDDGAGWKLEKLSGSQRTTGRFYTMSDTRLTYVGAGHVNGEKPRAYGASEQENQVAIVERLGEDTLVLQFPSPHYESKFDLMVLER
jgi:Domain of unknown function (DUF4893)